MMATEPRASRTADPAIPRRPHILAAGGKRLTKTQPNRLSWFDVKYFPNTGRPRLPGNGRPPQSERPVLQSNGAGASNAPARGAEDDSLMRPDTNDALNLGPEARRVRKHGSWLSLDQRPISRTLSPAFGALYVHGEIHDAPPDFVLRSVLPNIVLPQHVAKYVTAYFKDPIVHHCFHFANCMFVDFFQKRPIQHYTFKHKIRLLQLVNDAINDIGGMDLELLIFGISTIFKMSTHESDKAASVPQLFTPHGDPADLPRIMSRMETAESHAGALYRLLENRGLDRPFETFPGMEDTYHLVDTIISSINITKPRYLHSTNDVYNQWTNVPLTSLPIPDREGIGFVTNVPGTLPAQALAAFRNLALIDGIRCADTNDPSRAAHLKYFDVDPRVNAVQHRLLSVPTWDELDESKREDTTRVVYDSCRITALLYSNCVVHPVPITVGIWFEKLLSELRWLLENSGVPKPGHEALPLAVWVTFIGSMAAYRTKFYDFFTACLKQVLDVAGLGSWIDVHGILTQFLWSDEACGRGASVIWSELGLPCE